MSEQVQLPTDEVMRQMAKIAIEKATEDLAKFAIEMAAEMRRGEVPMLSGPVALEAWAAAIRSNNVLHYGRPEKGGIS